VRRFARSRRTEPREIVFAGYGLDPAVPLSKSEEYLTLSDPEFTLWLVRGSYSLDQSIEPFHGGPFEDPFAKEVQGIFLTEAEAREHAPELLATRAQLVSPTGYPPGLYPEPIAWLVTFIILIQDTGEAKLLVEPTFGGECRWNDDRDVFAIFQTRAEADAYAAARYSRS
jgi:hypothetical protein